MRERADVFACRGGDEARSRAAARRSQLRDCCCYERKAEAAARGRVAKRLRKTVRLFVERQRDGGFLSALRARAQMASSCGTCRRALVLPGAREKITRISERRPSVGWPLRSLQARRRSQFDFYARRLSHRRRNRRHRRRCRRHAKRIPTRRRPRGRARALIHRLVLLRARGARSLACTRVRPPDRHRDALVYECRDQQNASHLQAQSGDNSARDCRCSAPATAAKKHAGLATRARVAAAATAARRPHLCKLVKMSDFWANFLKR